MIKDHASVRMAFTAIICAVLSNCVMTGGVAPEISPLKGQLAREVATEVCSIVSTTYSRYNDSAHSTDSAAQIKNIYIQTLDKGQNGWVMAKARYWTSNSLSLPVSFNMINFKGTCGEPNDQASYVDSAQTFSAMFPDVYLLNNHQDVLSKVRKHSTRPLSLEWEGFDGDIEGELLPIRRPFDDVTVKSSWLSVDLPNHKGTCQGWYSTTAEKWVATSEEEWKLFCSDGLTVVGTMQQLEPILIGEGRDSLGRRVTLRIPLSESISGLTE